MIKINLDDFDIEAWSDGKCSVSFESTMEGIRTMLSVDRALMAPALGEALYDSLAKTGPSYLREAEELRHIEEKEADEKNYFANAPEPEPEIGVGGATGVHCRDDSVLPPDDDHMLSLWTRAEIRSIAANRWDEDIPLIAKSIEDKHHSVLFDLVGNVIEIKMDDIVDAVCDDEAKRLGEFVTDRVMERIEAAGITPQIRIDDAVIQRIALAVVGLVSNPAPAQSDVNAQFEATANG